MAKENQLTHKGYSHREWINDIMSDRQYDQEYQAVVFRNGHPTVYPDKYKEEYDEIAYNILSEPGATITKLCVALKITKQTFASWVKRHPSFKVAVATGGLVGEDAFRDEIKNSAFKPTSDVNNRLIKMIAGNVYGIREDEQPTIIINNSPALNKDGESAALYAEAIDRKDEYDLEIKAEDITDTPNIKQIN